MTEREQGFGRRLAAAESVLRTFPAPAAEAAAHSARLQQAVRAEIEAGGGAIPFARFMELALYAPGLGYYSAGARKFGEDGDFVTAPEISPLFARCIARQCRDVLGALGDGDILEFGAGSGAMAADLLAELQALGSLPREYLILEPSPDLRERQQHAIDERVPHLRRRVRWLDTLPAAGFRGVVVANEVLDAMPVHHFRVEHGQIEELHVAWRDDRFVETWREAGAALVRQVEQLQRDLGESLADGYQSEISLAHEPWLRAVASFLRQGLVLLIDYGYPRREYYHPQRHAGTLMCHYRHRAHDHPLVLIGLQDITAYVDFTALAQAGIDAGLELAGFTTQAHFLLGSGLDELLACSDPDDARSHLELARQVKVLTLPGEMGERFKVMGFTRDFDQPLPAFAGRDLRGRLYLTIAKQ